jgi:hypothetical protein
MSDRMRRIIIAKAMVLAIFALYMVVAIGIAHAGAVH